MATPKPEPSHPFQVGDCVRLIGENPWKGTLHGKKVYRVEVIMPHHILLLGDTGVKAYFASRWFEISDTGGPTMDDGVAEYEEAMKAQEMIDGL